MADLLPCEECEQLVPDHELTDGLCVDCRWDIRAAVIGGYDPYDLDSS